MSEPRRIIPILPAGLLNTASGIEAAHKVQARTTQGRFSQWRLASLWATQLFFFGMPWLQWQGRQMVLFDLEARRFYLGSLILLPQDLIFLTGLLVFCAMLLFVVTALAGRVWCGFSCPQTVYTAWFMWVERQWEGDRHQRLKLDAAPWGGHKLARRGGKQLSWVLISLATGLSFVGWFTPMRELSLNVLHGSLGFWDGFWALFYAGFCYLNAGLLREKVWLHMCPYGRFQGALMDADTLIVAYDAQRGEPRGAKRNTQDRADGRAQARQSGGCIDCTMCVQVCPTGIDIREGLQAACIGCGLCIDACDAIMDKIEQPRGLVRLTTQRQLAQAQASASGPGLEAPSTWARHRVRAYIALMVAMLGSLVWALSVRADIRMDVIRDRGVMARELEGGAVENVYRVQLMNQTERPQRIEISTADLPGAEAHASIRVLGPVQDQQVHVSVRLNAEQASRLRGQTLSMRLQVASRSDAGSGLISEPTTFIVPR